MALSFAVIAPNLPPGDATNASSVHVTFAREAEAYCAKAPPVSFYLADEALAFDQENLGKLDIDVIVIHQQH